MPPKNILLFRSINHLFYPYQEVKVKMTLTLKRPLPEGTPVRIKGESGSVKYITVNMENFQFIGCPKSIYVDLNILCGGIGSKIISGHREMVRICDG